MRRRRNTHAGSAVVITVGFLSACGEQTLRIRGRAGAADGLTAAPGAAAGAQCDPRTQATPLAKAKGFKASTAAATPTAAPTAAPTVCPTVVDRGTFDLREAFPGVGSYLGVSNTPLAALLCAGSRFLGIDGVAVCQGAAGGTVVAPSNVLSGTYYWNAAGVSTQGTMPNRGTWNLASGANESGYYDGTVSNAPAASAICELTTVHGVPGTAACAYASHVPSNLARTRGTARLMVDDEIAASSLPAGYREIPSVALDSDGFDGGDVTKASRPTLVCGMTQTTVAARVADCATRNGLNAAWDGEGKGNGSEGSWTLVTVFKSGAVSGDACAGGCSEVWRDDRTGLLWSDWLGSATSATTEWCLAAGNVENVGVDCRAGFGQQPASPQSWCAESAGLTTPTTYDSAKGGMRATATGTSPAVRWRLPTRRDYMLADLNGLRFVAPNAASHYWTSTLYSGDDDRAWRYEGDYGQVFYDANLYGGDGVVADDRWGATSRVRCVGR